MMPRSVSSEPPKAPKRKGVRSVSSLTPSQLARKRANDREAQRAIRARTKEHIERLEREIEELRSQQNRDKVIQNLLRRNKTLEDELRRLEETFGVSLSISLHSSPSSTPAGSGRLTRRSKVMYEESLSASSNGTLPSPRMSPLPSGGEYSTVPDYSQRAYLPLPATGEAWSQGLPANTVHSSVTSPSSSTAGPEDYGAAAAYMPTSMPASILNPPGAHLGGDKEPKMAAYGEMQHLTAQGYSLQQQQQQQQTHPHQHSQQHGHEQQRGSNWNMYPVYYSNPSHLTCVTR